MVGRHQWRRFIRQDQPPTDTHPNGKVTFALPHSLLVSLPLVRSAGLWHVGGLLPPQALAKLVHLRGHVLPGTVDTERDIISCHWLKRFKKHSKRGITTDRLSLTQKRNKEPKNWELAKFYSKECHLRALYKNGNPVFIAGL